MQAWAVINRGIGHWPPSEMDKMSLDEFDDWYQIAEDNIKAEIETNKVN